MASLQLDGARLEYYDEGEGEPIVLVHGSASDYRTWELQRAVFSKRHRVVGYSRRFHWPNEAVPEGVDYSMDQHVRDLESILRILKAAPARLVGHSYGAFLCLLLAIRRPELVRSLVLGEPPVITLFVSPTPKPSEMLRLFVKRPRTAAAIARLGIKGIAPATRAFQEGRIDEGVRAFGNAVIGRGGYDDLSKERKDQIKDNRTTLCAELLGSGFVPITADQVSAVRIPTLLVTGECSVRLFHRLTDHLEQLMPDVRRVEIPGATHNMHETNPPAFTAAVEAFHSS